MSGADNYAAHRSPVYRALWEPGAAAAAELFQIASDEVPANVQFVMDQSLQVLKTQRERGALRGTDGKHSHQVLKALGKSGYWGLLVERDYGGSGCGLRHFLPFLTQAAVIDAPLAGLAAVHGCIGAVDPLQSFGTAEQRQRHLPILARGERLSAFASTEPGAGSDLRAVETRAVRTADGWNISGQKAFITNLAPGRTIGLLCKVEEQLAVFVVDLPERENEHFELVPNPLHPLKHTINQGMRLRDLPVPADARLHPPENKDGRAIVFHGLNRGRAAICALAAGHLRVLLAGMIAWAKERQVQGKKLAELELIQSRCARVAALMAGCDALARWCGSLLDAGYRGELECLIAKVFASEAVKQAAFDLALPTHGGRFFLQGHPAGDLAYDHLAPCIYEGENDLLRLAMIQSLAKISGGLSPSLGVTGQPAWFITAWQRVNSQVSSNLLAARTTARTTNRVTQIELLEFARQIQALTVHGVSRAAATQGTVHRAGAELLCRRLQLQILSRRSSSADFRAEIRLGKALLTHELPWLSDAPAFHDALRNPG
jgi:alkylation response protein AidB-like acyl-CoA dehydrogenase